MALSSKISQSFSVTLMTPVIIADSAERAVARRKISRILTFEDGIDRHITLSGKLWANYDAALTAGYTVEQLHWIASDAAREFNETGECPDFEDELRRCVEQMATHMWTYTPEGRRQKASNWAGDLVSQT